MGFVSTFSEEERGYQARFAAVRQAFFRPLLRLCTTLGITPVMLSLCSMLGILLLPYAFLSSPAWALAAYGLHLFFDALDGSLARHQGVASDAGAYLDIVVDHFALLVSVLTLQWFSIGDPFWLLLYVLTYCLLIVHTVILHARGDRLPLSFVRSKYPLFVLVVLIVYVQVEVAWLTLFLQIFAVYYATLCVFFCAALYRSLRV